MYPLILFLYTFLQLVALARTWSLHLHVADDSDNYMTMVASSSTTVNGDDTHCYELPADTYITKTIFQRASGESSDSVNGYYMFTESGCTGGRKLFERGFEHVRREGERKGRTDDIMKKHYASFRMMATQGRRSFGGGEYGRNGAWGTFEDMK